MSRLNWLVFTDLDGTLLDHQSYSFEPALPALAALRLAAVPVIINSSKTLAEIAGLAQALDLQAPLIAENGSLIVYPDRPDQPPKILGADYQELCLQLDRLRTELGIACQGFHDVSAKVIAEWTGLPLAEAEKARQRQASEPLVWQDTEVALAAFQTALQAQGLVLKRGGRFWHLMGQTDKVRAMQQVAADYALQPQRSGHEYGPARLIALGDGPNDRDMLATADVAIKVYNPAASEFDWPQRPGQRRIHTAAAGPSGWNEAMLMLLAEAGMHRAKTD